MADPRSAYCDQRMPDDYPIREEAGRLVRLGRIRRGLVGMICCPRDLRAVVQSFGLPATRGTLYWLLRTHAPHWYINECHWPPSVERPPDDERFGGSRKDYDDWEPGFGDDAYTQPDIEGPTFGQKVTTFFLLPLTKESSALGRSTISSVIVPPGCSTDALAHAARARVAEHEQWWNDIRISLYNTEPGDGLPLGQVVRRQSAGRRPDQLSVAIHEHLAGRVSREGLETLACQLKEQDLQKPLLDIEKKDARKALDQRIRYWQDKMASA